MKRRVLIPVTMLLVTWLFANFIERSNLNNENVFASDQQKPKPVTRKKKVVPSCFQMSPTQLSGLMGSAKGNQLFVDIYPVRTSSNGKDEVGFETLVRDEAGNVVGKDIKEASLKKRYGAFVAFMKQKKIPQSEVPYGFIVKYDEQDKEGDKCIDFCYDYASGKATYNKKCAKYQLQGSVSSLKYYHAKDSAAVCKTPPGGCSLLSLRSLNLMKTVVDSVYKY